ncbi:Dynein regulatory complex protein 8, partial [Taenia solium]
GANVLQDLENIDAKVFEAFDLFDHERNKTVDSRELGTIVRSLGLCPSEADLLELTAKLENSPPNGYINYENFLPVIGQILIDNISILPEEEIVRAFQAFDPEKTGVVDPDILEEHLMKEGEKFTRDEMDEMLASAIDVQKNGINYRDKDYFESVSTQTAPNGIPAGLAQIGSVIHFVSVGIVSNYFILCELI